MLRNIDQFLTENLTFEVVLQFSFVCSKQVRHIFGFLFNFLCELLDMGCKSCEISFVSLIDHFTPMCQRLAQFSVCAKILLWFFRFWFPRCNKIRQFDTVLLSDKKSADNKRFRRPNQTVQGNWISVWNYCHWKQKDFIYTSVSQNQLSIFQKICKKQPRIEIAVQNKANFQKIVNFSNWKGNLKNCG